MEKDLKTLGKNTGRVVKHKGRKMAIYKDSKGDLHYFSPRCTHKGCEVAWDDNEKVWICNCHNSRFSPTGSVISGPAEKPLSRIADKGEGEHKVRILNSSFVTHDVKRFVVEKPNGFDFTPGQATEVSINKKGLVNEFRPFTFTSLDNDLILEFTIKRYPEHDGVTDRLHSLKSGDEIFLKKPFGTIGYEGKGVYLAGGAGVTPFVAILRELAVKDKLEGNKLIFSNKLQKDIIYEKEFREYFGDELVLTLTREEVEGYESGRIDKAMIEKYIDDYSQNFYVCGPPGFVKAIKSLLKEKGVKVDEIVFEK